LETTIPGIIPIVLYGDLALVNANDGYFDGNTNTYVSKYTPTFLYTSGISLVLFKDVFRVNIPVMASKAITDYFKGNTPGSLTGEQRYTERITFSLNLNKINPIKSVRKISF
jgi:hypothetical protein